MIAVLCALLSGAGFYLSTNLGEMWWLAWLAPIPVLWLAFGEERAWVFAAAAFAACDIGALNLLPAYGGLFPLSTLAFIFTLPALSFAGCVVAARIVRLRLGDLAGVFAFAALWTAWDFLASFGPDGTAASPAYSQVGMPILIQSASLFGLWSITFLLGVFAAGFAASLRTRAFLPAGLAIALFVANAGFGAWRMMDAPNATMRVGLVANDDLGDAAFRNDAKTAMTVLQSYADVASKVAQQGATLVVLPERIATIFPVWGKEATAILQAVANSTNATIVVGVGSHESSAAHNVAWVIAPRKPVLTYTKRHLVPGLERQFTPGSGALIFGGNTGIEICKDMDFQAMIRNDASRLHPSMLAVPAWDFDRDDYGHARMAIMRSVENGVSQARSARLGLLTLNDAYGRVIARKKSGGGIVTLVGNLPLAQNGGATIYDRIGDLFGWFALVLSLGLLAFAFSRRPVSR